MSHRSSSTISSGPVIPYRTASWTLAAKIDLNRCTCDKLARVPGVGRRAAEGIIQYRRDNKCFLHVKELWRVPGMTERLFGALANNVYVPEGRQPRQRPRRASARNAKGPCAASASRRPESWPEAAEADWKRPAVVGAEDSAKGVSRRGLTKDDPPLSSHTSILTESRRMSYKAGSAFGDVTTVSGQRLCLAAEAASPGAAAASRVSRFEDGLQPVIVRTSKSRTEVTMKYPPSNDPSRLPMAITVKMKPLRRDPEGSGPAGSVKPAEKKPASLAALGTKAVARVGRSLSDALSKISGASRSVRSAPKEDRGKQEKEAGQERLFVTGAPEIEGWLSGVNEATRASPEVREAAGGGGGPCIGASGLNRGLVAEVAASEMSYRSVTSSSKVSDSCFRRVRPLASDLPSGPARRRRPDTATGKSAVAHSSENEVTRRKRVGKSTSRLGVRASDSLVLKRRDRVRLRSGRSRDHSGRRRREGGGGERSSKKGTLGMNCNIM